MVIKMDNENMVAVIGMSGRFPQADSVDSLWKNLLKGKDCIQHFTEEEMKDDGVPLKDIKAENYVNAKGIINEPDAFDAEFFDYTVKDAMIMDPQARVFLEEVWKAIEDSGNVISRYKGRVGVYAGSGMNTYLLRLLQNGLPPDYDDFDIMLGSDKDLLSTRVSYKLNLTGPSITVQSTCSTSLVAVHLACQGLLGGDCDMAVAGGVSVSYPIKKGYQYRRGMIYSKKGRCHPFDTHSDGTVFSDGVGVVVLKRLNDAIKDKDAIYGVVMGTAVNNDGNNKVGFTAPSPVGQAKVIQDCLDAADVPVDTIQYVEAHGTATEIGDLLEVKAISKVYSEYTSKHNYCALGSVKSNVGHLNTASGITGFIKALLVLAHRTIPPMANFTQENEKLNLLDSQFYINRYPVPLQDGKKARVAVSSFGIGGTNAHVIIEEAPLRQEETHENPQYHIFPFSAKTKVSLLMNMLRFAEWLGEKNELSLPSMASMLQNGRESFGIRKAIVSTNKEDLQRQLDKAISEEKAVKSTSKPVYFLITGQGSQYINMAKGLYENIEFFKGIIDKGVGLIKEKYSEDLLKILYPDQEHAKDAAAFINETEYAQPLIFMVSYALGRYLMSLGIHPNKIIGHSLGEYVGACLAGVMSYEEGMDLTYQRGKIFQNAERGKMLAVKASPEYIEELGMKEIHISTINAQEAVVIGGSIQAIAEAETIFLSRGIVFLPLHTSHAFHTPMMKEAAQKFENYIREMSLKDPEITLISNVTAQEAQPGQLSNPAYWKEHILSPVLFSQSVHHLLQGEEAVFIEIGSGTVLIDLARQQNMKENHVFVDMLPNRFYKQSQYGFFLEKLASLWEMLASVHFESDIKPAYNKIHMPTYCFDRQKISLLVPKSSEDDIKADKYYDDNTDYSIRVRRDHISSQYIEPRDEMEELLLNLLKRNIGYENIGVYDKFFELGFSSLSASHYAMQIKESIDLDIEIRDIIESGCVASLSEIAANVLLTTSE